MVAHRTSPTNIGLYLLATLCAREFGWIGTQRAARAAGGHAVTLEELPRHRGHFLNWYDTRRSQALLPQYVSSVDSGNLCRHLLALAQACLELDAATRRRPGRCGAHLAAVGDAERHRCAARGRASALAGASALAAPARSTPIRSTRLRADPPASTCWSRRRPPRSRALASPKRQRAQSPPSAAAPLLGLGRRATDARDLALGLRDARRHADASRAALGAGAPREPAERSPREADFASSTTASARLFHIGFRVAEQQLDASFYDLLASEARAASLWAIAKGDVPAAHWFRARPAARRRSARAGLRSWSGSMFEYLMPPLVLRRAAWQRAADRRAAVRRQIALRARAPRALGHLRIGLRRAATTPSPTSTRRRACRAWRCAARRPTSW